MVENNLVSILEGLQLNREFDVTLQGTLDPSEGYPDNFFTYWNWESPRDGYYNNKTTKTNYAFQIEAYSTDRNFLLTMIEKAIKELELNNYIIPGDGEDIASNIPSHTGKMIEVYFIKKKGE